MPRALVSLLLAAAGIAAFGLAGCGEREQTAHYEEGRYRGKPDTPPYQAAPFNGDVQKYNAAMRERAQNQNEYNRIK
ncbi:MAG: hypothetical protein GEV05_18030 [Betaproteobacteria bacterium]|nr:hypothetical protein [Betaproteobacteria bacterium]